ncbi:chymotrypsin family serine protease [Glaciibacter psychrotolerans]|uniref:Trypsin-like serine protease n=1 Tax=Glaciibacter psychrotolerans TaxID=670054 RepID=A0A7Z0EDC7_9MICO|nr:hypothetical protein [Leifsonia psychrotolerans]NYJ19533.1 hypothetical protein [Leifsonia psychrotolerans]
MKIRDIGPQVFPDKYGGMATGKNDDQDVLAIYLTRIDEGDLSKVSDLLAVPPDKIDLRLGHLTSVQAEATFAKIGSDIANGALTGTVSVGITQDISILLKVSDQNSERVSSLQRQYGVGVEVEYGAAIEDQGANARWSDNPEWYGGDFITDRSSRGCTSSFPVKWNTNGNKYILTAGHCFGLTASVYNYATSPISHGINSFIGGVTNRSFANNAPDAELISADGSRSMWTGATNGTGLIEINAFSNPWAGMPLCISGAYDGEYCGFTASEVNTNAYISYGSVTHLVLNLTTIMNGNDQSIGPGDSGGPAYATINGVTYGLGIITSVRNNGTNSTVTCSNWSTQFASSGGRGCNNWGRITNIGPIMSMWNLSLD